MANKRYKKKKTYSIRRLKKIMRKIKQRKDKKYVKKVEAHIIINRIFNKLFNFTDTKGFYSSIRQSKRTFVKIIVPQKFCLITNPDEVFDFIKKIIGYSKNIYISRIEFDYSSVEILELGAVLLKNVVVLNLQKIGICITGNFPSTKNLEALNIFLYSGIYKYLGLNPDAINQEINKSMTFEMRGAGICKPDISVKEIELGRTEEEITKYFNKCLMKSGYVLKEDGIRKFDHILSEVLSNCIEHCGKFGQHYCLGHYYEYSKGFGKYQLSILNFGQSIAEGLANASLPDSLQNRIDALIKIHKEKHWFGFGWDEELLLTLLALQDRVSRVFKESDTRGTGSIRLIESFQAIGGTNKEEFIPKMTIISGNSQIVFDNSNLSKLSDRNTVAFNLQNNLEDLPDKKHVKKIANYLPGTVITLSIFLDQAWITKAKEENDNEYRN